MKRRYPYFAKKRRFPAKTAARPIVAELERVCRENHELRQMRDDIRALVTDMNMRRPSLVTYIVAINAIRKLVLP